MGSTNSSVIDIYKKELEEIPPLGTGRLIPPYQPDQNIEEKLKDTVKALRRSIGLKDRLMSLVNAYHLGKLINEAESTTICYQRKRKIERHYCTMAEYTYDIFEIDPSQLLGTSTINVQQIKRLRRTQVLQLRRILENKLYTHLETIRS